MTSQAESVPSGAYAILELLAAQAPPAQVEEFVRRAWRESARSGQTAELARAGELAQGVHALIDRRRQREARLAALVDAARSLALPADLDTVLELVARRARLLLNAEMAYISFHDREAGYSEVRGADGHSSALTLGYRVELDPVFTDAIDAPGAFWSPDYPADERVRHSDELDAVVRAERLRALIAVRLRRDGTTFATLYTADRGVRYFTPDEVSLAGMLGDLAAAAVDRAADLERTRARLAELDRGGARTRADLAAVRRLSDIHQSLVSLALGGRDLPALAAQAGAALGGELLVCHPAADSLAAAAGHVPDLDEPAVLEVSRRAHAERRPLALPDGTWVAPAAAGSEALGTVVLRAAAPLDEHGVRLLELATQAVAVLLLMQRTEARAQGRPRDELLDLLIADTRRPPHELADRARSLSLDLYEPYVIVVARPEGGAGGRTLRWASSYAHRTNGLKSVRGDSLVFLVPGTDPGAAARAVCGELGSALGCPVTVGAAGPAADPGSAHGAYREAGRCLDALVLLGCTGCAGSPRELGFLGLLLSDNHDVDGFIGATLGPVIEHDRQRSTELVRSIEAYFASGCSPTRAAQALHMHPNTVSRRLARISELLGPDWQSPARAMEIQLALRLRRTRGLLTRQYAPAQPES